MSIITKAPLQLPNLAATPAAPADGSVLLYSGAGVLTV
jgi:hypothetical protein